MKPKVKDLIDKGLLDKDMIITEKGERVAKNLPPTAMEIKYLEEINKLLAMEGLTVEEKTRRIHIINDMLKRDIFK